MVPIPGTEPDGAGGSSRWFSRGLWDVLPPPTKAGRMYVVVAAIRRRGCAA